MARKRSRTDDVRALAESLGVSRHRLSPVIKSLVAAGEIQRSRPGAPQPLTRQEVAKLLVGLAAGATQAPSFVKAQPYAVAEAACYLDEPGTLVLHWRARPFDFHAVIPDSVFRSAKQALGDYPRA